MEEPNVSVCLASYNGEKYISVQIDSILSQLKPNDELIISDDGSTDRTLEIISAIKDPRIKVFSGNTFRDPIRNFQNTLSKAKGNYIFLSDQDDIWMPDKYEKMLTELKHFDLVISDSKIVDEDLNVIEDSFFSYFNSGPGIIKNLIKSSYYGSCMAFSKEILKKALPFPDTKEIGHDLWIGLVAEMTGSISFMKQQLILYRRHTSAFTPVEVGKSKRTKKQMLRGRIIMIKEILKFTIKNSLWKRG